MVIPHTPDVGHMAFPARWGCTICTFQMSNMSYHVLSESYQIGESDQSCCLLTFVLSFQPQIYPLLQGVRTWVSTQLVCSIRPQQVGRSDEMGSRWDTHPSGVHRCPILIHQVQKFGSRPINSVCALLSEHVRAFWMQGYRVPRGVSLGGRSSTKSSAINELEWTP